MVVAVANMALLRSPILACPPFYRVDIRLSSRLCFSANFSNHFDAFSGQKRALGEVQSRHRVCFAQASAGEGDRKETQSFPPGELQYLGKFSASCVAGAILVKYGSLLVPSVTSPNLNVALLLITAPCLVSVALLVLASIFSSDGNTRKQ